MSPAKSVLFRNNIELPALTQAALSAFHTQKTDYACAIAVAATAMDRLQPGLAYTPDIEMQWWSSANSGYMGDDEISSDNVENAGCNHMGLATLILSKGFRAAVHGNDIDCIDKALQGTLRSPLQKKEYHRRYAAHMQQAQSQGLAMKNPASFLHAGMLADIFADGGIPLILTRFEGGPHWQMVDKVEGDTITCYNPFQDVSCTTGKRPAMLTDYTEAALREIATFGEHRHAYMVLSVGVPRAH